MRFLVPIAALLVSLALPTPAPAQNGCAAPATLAQPAQTPPGGDGTLGLTRLGAFGGAVTAAARSATALYVGQGAAVSATPAAGGVPLTTPLNDLPRDIVATPDAAYVAAGSAGLRVVGGSVLPLPGLANALTVVGATAYVAAGGVGGGLHIVDVSRPAQLRLLGTAPVFGSADGVVVAGSIAYVAGGVNGGVELFTVADPTAPARLSGLITPGAARAVTVAADRAYVAAGTCGLQTLDIGDPAAPRLLGAVAAGGEALDLALDGSRLYVAAGAGGVAVFELSSGAPQFVAQIAVPGFVRRVSIHDDELLIAAEAGGLYALALGVTPEALQQVRAGAAPLAVAVDGGRALLGLRQGGIQVVDLNDPAQPPVRSIWETAAAVRALAPAQNRLYAGVDGVGIVTLELSGLEAPEAIAQTTTAGQVTALLIDPSAERLYAALGSAGVAIYSVSEPGAPQLVRTIDTPGTALGLALSAERLLVADRTGLQVIDLSANRISGAFSAPAGSFVQGVAVAGATAFLADRTGLLVVDLSNPAAPRQVGAAAGFTAYAVRVEGTRAFVAAGPGGVFVFDGAQPAQPRLLTALDTPGSSLDVTIENDQVAVADEAGGLLILSLRALPNRVVLPLIGR